MKPSKVVRDMVETKVRRGLPSLGEHYVAATQKILSEERDWPHFSGSTTVRKSPDAKVKKVQGSRRDTIDSWETHDSVKYEQVPGNILAVDVYIDTEFADVLLAQRDVFGMVQAETNAVRAINDAWE